MPWEEVESKMVKDADNVTQGACNPIAVAGVLHDMLRAASRHQQSSSHPAIQVTLSHLAHLVCGNNVEGADWEAFFRLVEKETAKY
jgi:hypothetical protein